MVNSNLENWSCFFANIFQVRHGVLDILSCWLHPHGNDQYEHELNLFSVRSFVWSTLIVLRCDIISFLQEVKGKNSLTLDNALKCHNSFVNELQTSKKMKPFTWDSTPRLVQFWAPLLSRNAGERRVQDHLSAHARRLVSFLGNGYCACVDLA